jgi:transposase InsO family protein
VSDNGSQFVSEEFKSYLEELGIKHTGVTPYWARANGLVENFNKSLKKTIRAARAENENWHNKLYTFLLLYRNAPHLTTGRTPAELLFNKPL